MSRYAKRLDRDLVRWREAGWINADGEAAIRRDIANPQDGKLDLAAALGILGAVLIGFGAMSFVAAHWNEMPRLFRLALIFGGLFASYGIAGVLFERKHPTFAHAAILVGVSIFGAGIMLIAQMFHIEGHPPDAVLTWALGALAAGVILRSNPALAVAMLLVCLWTGWEMSDDGRTFWPFLLGWGAVTAAIGWQRWGAGLQLAAVAMALWIISLGYTLAHGNGHGIVVILGLLIATAGFVAPRIDDRLSGWSTTGAAYGMSVAFAGLFALQFIKDPSLSAFILLAILSLALVLGGVALGLKLGSPALLWLGYAGFSIEVLGIYFKTVGTLLGSSLFFLSAGVLVILLSVIAYRLHARVQPSVEAAPADHKLIGDMPAERRNLWLAVAAVALGQAAVLGWMIWDRVALLAQGREVVLEVVPVDPRSLFRGDYVVLGYDISRFSLPPGATVPEREHPFYITLRKGPGESWQSVAGASEPPARLQPDEVVIKGRVDYVARPASDQPQQPTVLGLHYGIESFFVPEGTGRDLEKMVGDKKISALIAIDGAGQAAIKGLISDGHRVYDEPLL